VSFVYVTLASMGGISPVFIHHSGESCDSRQSCFRAHRHSGEGRNPWWALCRTFIASTYIPHGYRWIPAFAGMTVRCFGA